MSKGGILLSIFIVAFLTIGRLNDPNPEVWLAIGGVINLFLFGLLIWGIIRSHTPTTGRAILLMILCIIFPPILIVLLILWALGFDREARAQRAAAQSVTQADIESPGEDNNLILDAVVRYAPLIDDKSVSFAPQICHVQLENAVKSYASEARSVLMLIDTTLRKNGKEGLLISAEGLFIKEIFDAPRKMLIYDLKKVEAKESLSDIKIRVNGRKFGEISVGSESTRKALVDMLNSIKP